MPVPGLENSQLYTWIGASRLYCQTPAALCHAITRLKQHGYTCEYTVTPCIDPDTYHPEYFWLALNHEVNRAKCTFCGGFNRPYSGISHRTIFCMHCSRPIWRYMGSGSTITLRPLLYNRKWKHWPTRRESGTKFFTMRVISWDEATGQLDLEPHFLPFDVSKVQSPITDMCGQKGWDYINRNPGVLRPAVRPDGRLALRTNYRFYCHPEDAPRSNRVRVSMSLQFEINYQVIQIWDDIETTTNHAQPRICLYAGWRDAWTSEVAQNYTQGD